MITSLWDVLKGADLVTFLISWVVCAAIVWRAEVSRRQGAGR